jgi:hypothetical protein
MTKKPDFLNFHVDHMTLLLQPELYPVAYVLFKTIFGVTAEDLLYDKRKEWVKGEGEKSMTYALRLGSGVDDAKLINTIVAVVQPSEPKNRPSHVRSMLDDHGAAAHWQHVALRTRDLLAFHRHALERGVNFITPILKDDEENLIQVFSGEWYFPGSKPSGMFFEFLQRDPSDQVVAALKDQNRRWFRDETFMGLYEEKEREYQSGTVTPFIDHALFEKLYDRFGGRNTWEITTEELKTAETMMIDYARAKRG